MQSCYDDFDCVYVPGSHTVIDLLRANGLTACFGESLDQVRKRYPGAEICRFRDWRVNKGNEQDGPVTWTETTEREFMRALEVLPPAIMERGGFLLGEPFDHHAMTGQPRYAAYVKRGGRFFAASRHMTEDQFRTVEMPRS